MAMVRDRISDLLNRHGYTTRAVESGEAAIALAQTGAPIQLVLLDILMPQARIEGIEAARILSHEHVIPCLMLTTVEEAAVRVAAAFAGALGYLVKDVAGDEVILAGVRAALAGEPIPDPTTRLVLDDAEAVSVHQRRMWIQRAFAKLTERQREVARLAARGLTNKEIAQQLVLEVATINSHMQEILARLGLVSRRELQTRVLYDSLIDQEVVS